MAGNALRLEALQRPFTSVFSHAARELFASGKIPPPDTKEGAAAGDRNAPGAANNFDPEEINPPVAAKGGLTALLHAARQGYVDAAGALLDGGADINQVSAGEGTSPPTSC